MIQIVKYGEVDPASLFIRGARRADVRETVAAIIADVRENGDRALFADEERFDRAKLTSLEVTRQ